MKEMMVLLTPGLTMLCVRSHSHCMLLMFILLFLELTCLVIYYFVLIFTSPSVNSRIESRIIWSKVTHSSIISFQDKVFKKLFDPPLEFLECTKPACTTHTGLLTNHVVSTLLDSAGCCFPSSAPSPRKLAGWNDGAAKLKKQSAFWHNVWTYVCWLSICRCSLCSYLKFVLIIPRDGFCNCKTKWSVCFKLLTTVQPGGFQGF